LKAQFINVNKLQGKDDVPNHISAMDAWAPMHAHNGDGVSPSIVDLDTVEQRAVYQPQPDLQAQYPLYSQLQGSARWNGAWDDPTNPLVQSLMHGPVSPNESGVTPYATLYAKGPQPLELSPPAQKSLQAFEQPFTGPFTRPFVQPFESFPQPYATSLQTMQPAAFTTFAPQSQPLSSAAQWPLTNMPGFPAAPAYQSYQQVMGGPPPYMQPPMMPPVQPGGKRRKKQRRFPIWARVIVGILLFLTLLGGGGYAYYLINFAKPIGDITNQPAPRLKGDDNPNQNLNGNILSGPRINILLLGSDTDQKFGTSVDGSNVYLAQTDIIVSIDPATNAVAMLSIPRDFYINIPGFGMGKLDEAFEHGYSYGQGGFPGAVALSRLTIYQDFGIPINYYAWVGLDGFVKVINTVGGVDVDVLHPITDDAYPDDVGNNTGDIYAYKRLYIPPGPQHLSGEQALEYVRSRHADLVGDFGRSARQQQVLGALKTKLDNPGIIGQLSQIANDLDGFVKTDMQLIDVLKLMNFARTLDSNKVQRVILEPPYSSSATLPSGESIVRPNCAAIIPVIAQVFQLGGQARCDITASSTTTQLASSQAPATPGTPGAKTSAAIQQTAQLAGTNSLSLLAGSAGDSLLGFHSILDLLFAVVFESPQAMQV
jgi:LCP family protein required for cell wall assembly